MDADKIYDLLREGCDKWIERADYCLDKKPGCPDSVYSTITGAYYRPLAIICEAIENKVTPEEIKKALDRYLTEERLRFEAASSNCV